MHRLGESTELPHHRDATTHQAINHADKVVFTWPVSAPPMLRRLYGSDRSAPLRVCVAIPSHALCRSPSRARATPWCMRFQLISPALQRDKETSVDSSSRSDLLVH